MVQDQVQLMLNPEEELIEIMPRIYWMTFPKLKKIHHLSNLINHKFDKNYYIWNLSEHSYETEHFFNQVACHQYNGSPCPPLFELFVISKNILNWLEKDQENIAIVQCQYNRGRSIIILSLLMALILDDQPDQCFLRVCEIIHIKEYHFFPSHHTYLKYICNSYFNLPFNSQKIRLVSILFNQVPILNQNDEALDSQTFCPLIEIYVENKIIYTSQETLQYLQPNDPGCIFYLGGIEIDQDIQFKCKHYENDEMKYPGFRTMFHSSFLFQNVLRLYPKDLDISDTLIMPEDFFIDLIFEFGDEISSQNIGHNKSRIDEITDIKLSDNIEPIIKCESEFNRQLKMVVEQCKEVGERFRSQQIVLNTEKGNQQIEQLEQQQVTFKTKTQLQEQENSKFQEYEQDKFQEQIQYHIQEDLPRSKKYANYKIPQQEEEDYDDYGQSDFEFNVTMK